MSGLDWLRIAPAPWDDAKAVAKARKPRVGQGRHGTVTKVPDSIVAHIRHMSEVERKPRDKIAKSFPGLSRTYIRDILEYTLRVKVKAAPPT